MTICMEADRAVDPVDIPAMELPATLGPGLTESQARDIFHLGEEAVVFALLALAKRVGQQQTMAAETSPATPSAMIPVYQKASRRGRSKTPGRKTGHEGARRPKPITIHRRPEHHLSCCPHCQGPVRQCRHPRKRLIEDLPENLEPEVAEHTINRYWCGRCRKRVEPVVTEALPGSTLGLRTQTLSAWLHYGLGNTLSQIVDVFNYHLQLKVTPGGLMKSWYRLQEILYPWYEQIQEQALDAGVLHADETGWRVNGQTHWLWCFTTPHSTYYLIDRQRGRPVLRKFFKREFAGVLVSDFWGAYNAVTCAAHQKCLPHLLRELVKVEKYHQPTKDWHRFAKKLRRLLRDAIRLKKNEALPVEVLASRKQRVHERLRQLIATPWQDRHARRLIKRLRRHAQDLFTFLDHPQVPFDNNHAERTIRPAVIIRKNSYNNRSEAGADLQAVMMSVHRTLKQRGLNPMKTITAALRTYLQSGKLPPLPENPPFG